MTEKNDLQSEKKAVSEALPFMPVVETLGTRLKKTREEKGIELKQIADELCIRESFLKALEDGEYSDFPALVYGAGFLRSYASFLGLDVKEIMQQFHNETKFLVEKSTEAPVLKNKNVIPSKKLLIGIFSLALLAWGGFALFKNEPKEPIEIKTLNEVVPEVPVAPAPVTTDELVENVTQNQVEVVQEAKPETNLTDLSNELKAAVPAPKEETVEETKPIEEKPVEPVAYGAKSGSRLMIKATDKVWIEIKNAEKIIFNKVLNKGDTYNVYPNSEEMLMRTGNAGALSIYLDGEFKKVVGKPGHILRDISLSLSEYED